MKSFNPKKFRKIKRQGRNNYVQLTEIYDGGKERKRTFAVWVLNHLEMKQLDGATLLFRERKDGSIFEMFVKETAEEIQQKIKEAHNGSYTKGV